MIQVQVSSFKFHIFANFNPIQMDNYRFTLMKANMNFGKNPPKRQKPGTGADVGAPAPWPVQIHNTSFEA